jgi:23S rRNA (cytidine1920-2'-O)/16S rRNA (cytidine1409-2'-O)-methyltransferase
LATLFKDKVVLDVGASKGGFTDCVLQLGARTVLALDVGFNQLDWRLRTDPRVVVLEQTDIREFDPGLHAPFDWILADISFNTLERLAPALVKLASIETKFLILVKPQFELPGKDVPSGGVIRSEELWNKAIQVVLNAFERLGVGHFKIAKSALKGRSGNQEFFVYCFPVSTGSESTLPGDI